jgi:hypothetical protein
MIIQAKSFYYATKEALSNKAFSSKDMSGLLQSAVLQT